MHTLNIFSDIYAQLFTVAKKAQSQVNDDYIL